ncbi:anthranilate phosphoribosyltransferase [Telmatocola sphagniphila]|uniref:Anthranilate phosphoribosyltransferase n=1 Tax=Telmatocola sphagniphila TaxID=1123043 RepID=A0A8E6EVN8_9BACT|nr:anthranilate phosphoribosyltransferase [Telmatocola sphagniphila]QVL32995.1 anthranilate phosphoribosyltransferase [Telmatocola sphagniphila]
MSDSTKTSWCSAAVAAFLDRRRPSNEVLRTAFDSITDARVDEATAASFLTALRFFETWAEPIEIAEILVQAATVLREKMLRIDCRGRKCLDTCGTGGDHSGTFNISTAVALVVAGAGVPVVKHGNRSASSRSGSSDVLEILGVPIQAGPDWSQRCLDEFGLAFCFAPSFHPALKFVAPVRRKLGFRTLFNFLGPLLNPASVPYQLIGVGELKAIAILAEACRQLNFDRVWILHGLDGLDEITLGDSTRIQEIHQRVCTPASEIEPSDLGLRRFPLSTFQIQDAAESAKIIERILSGEDIPHRQIVLANAAAALVVAQRVKTLSNGVELALESILSGKAKAVLKNLQNSR